ncbi:hypothetical protein EVAR_98711_1 [Eumeta japonica]|uniref:Uncharacterized protein n=1 Tax=Eumeta variegata TaxID=151549 RepID=A0A4C1XUK9_EUMVA|nr:hypothetical protein EVAR_98711_1 [Eumeta japonica]
MSFIRALVTGPFGTPPAPGGQEYSPVERTADSKPPVAHLAPTNPGTRAASKLFFDIAGSHPNALLRAAVDY